MLLIINLHINDSFNIDIRYCSEELRLSHETGKEERSFKYYDEIISEKF